MKSQYAIVLADINSNYQVQGLTVWPFIILIWPLSLLRVLIVFVIERLLNLVDEVLRVQIYCIRNVLHEIDCIGKGKAFTLDYFGLICDWQVLQLLKYGILGNVEVGGNLLGLEVFEGNVWKIINQIPLSHICPLLFLGQHHNHDLWNLEFLLLKPLCFYHIEVLNVQIVNMELRIAWEEVRLLWQSKC